MKDISPSLIYALEQLFIKSDQSRLVYQLQNLKFERFFISEIALNTCEIFTYVQKFEKMGMEEKMVSFKPDCGYEFKIGGSYLTVFEGCFGDIESITLTNLPNEIYQLSKHLEIISTLYMKRMKLNQQDFENAQDGADYFFSQTKYFKTTLLQLIQSNHIQVTKID